MLQLNPDLTAPPLWDDELPEPLRHKDILEAPIRGDVERRLASAGLKLHSCWSYDVPEMLIDAKQLYLFLTFGCGPDEVPAFMEIRATLEFDL